MKTPVLIDLLCNISNALDSVIRTGLMLDDDTLEEHGAYSCLGDCDDAARTIYRALPEQLRTEEMDEVVSNLYIHIHRGDDKTQRETLKSLRESANKLFHFSYDLHAEMTAAKNRFELCE